MKNTKAYYISIEASNVIEEYKRTNHLTSNSLALEDILKGEYTTVKDAPIESLIEIVNEIIENSIRDLQKAFREI